ncbi:MAG: hypothetical protein R3D57_01425 [Hyphomicrobiaceae bacterium]
MSDAPRRPARITLRLRSTAPSRLALQAAVEAARALEQRLSSVFIESSELVSLAALSCAREVTVASRRGNALTSERVEADLRLAAASAHRELRQLAAMAGIDLDFEVVRDDPAAALERALEPGALLALDEPFHPGDAVRLSHLLNEVEEIAGALITGPRSLRRRGPVVVAIEDAERAPALLTVADRLQTEVHQGIVLVLIGDTPERIRTLHSAIGRLPQRDRPIEFAHAQIARAAAGRGSAGVLAEAVIRYQGSFAIAHLGRLIRARERELTVLSQTLECPLLLLK